MIENEDTEHLFLIDGVQVLCSNRYAYDCAKGGATVERVNTVSE
jgi:hypothetical protein